MFKSLNLECEYDKLLTVTVRYVGSAECFKYCLLSC